MPKKQARPPAPTDSRTNPEDLAARAAEGDDDAFEELHRRCAAGLRRFLQRRLGNASERLDEVCQMTWVEVWRALRGGRYDPGRARVTTFVYAVGNKVLLRHFRQAGRGAVYERDATGILGQIDRAASPEELLSATEWIDAMRDCLHARGGPNALTPDERSVLVGLLGGSSERALAGEFGIAASTVNVRKQAAYVKLRRCLGQKGFREPFAERDGG